MKLGTLEGERVADGDIVLQLTQPGSTLRGVVRERGGAPLAGCEVWILDPTPFGVRSSGLPGDVGQPIFLESILAGAPRKLPQPVTTDEHGAFLLPGLAATPYRLCILAPGGSSVLQPPPVRATGAAIPFEVSADERETLEGTVVAKHGRAIEGARVAAVLAQINVPIPWTGWRFRRDLLTREATSDAEGRFRIEGMLPRPAILTITGADIFPANRELARACNAPLEVRVSERVRLRFRYPGADAFSVLDSEGRCLPISTAHLDLFPILGPESFQRTLDPVLDEEWSIPKDAVEIVAYKGEVECARLPLKSLLPREAVR